MSLLRDIPDDPLARPRLAPAWAAAAIGSLAIALLTLAAWTWRAGPDPLIDFGRDVYVAWRLAEGERLYLDVAYFNGPLSPHLNALFFHAAGASVQTLAVANVALLALAAALLWRVVRQIADELAAYVACAILVVLCGFLQLLEVANYSFAYPYSHEMTHGFIASIASIAAMLAFLKGRNGWWLGLSGSLCGLTLLTKPEFGVALVPALALGIVLALLERRASLGRWAARVGTFCLGIAVPVVIAFVLLAWSGLGSDGAGRGVLGGWRFVFDPSLHALPFYRHVAGTSDVTQSLKVMSASLAAWAILAAAGIAAGKLLRNARAHDPWALAGSAVVVIVVAMSLATIGFWQHVFRGFNVVVAATWTGLIVIVVHRGRQSLGRRLIGQVVFVTFALLLLAKIRLNVSLTHYGFVLALPAVVVGIALGLAWTPTWLERRGASGAALRGAVIGMFLCIAWVYVDVASIFRERRTDPIAADTRDEILLPPDLARPINRLLTVIEQTVNHDETIAVLPEGTLLNVLTGRPSGSVHPILMPAEVRMFGEPAIVESLTRAAPHWIVLNTRTDLQSYGVRTIADYAPALARFVAENYADQTPPALQGTGFALLRRR
jgi:hypothetical protein